MESFGGKFVKRFVAWMLVVLVSLPWAAIPTARATACAMPSAKAVESCAYCAPSAASVGAGERLEAGCCRFLPNQESTPAQAGSIGSAPKPQQTPDAATGVLASMSLGEPLAAVARDLSPRADSPPLVSPTRTTHLLL